MTLPLWGSQPAQGGRAFKEPPRRLSLVRLAAEIARSLSGIGQVAVEGEVYRPQTSKGGWVYFVLRERAAQVPVVCPARNARRCRAVPGERVVVVGALVWGNERGQLVLEADEVSPVGEGAMAAMIAESRARLAAEGLIDRPRRTIPRLPEAIGVICGTDAAVRKDIESVVAARFPGYPVVFEETTVSGPGAAPCITEALAQLVAKPGVEVVVLARGGGDATALLPWSDEELCRAVATSPLPVVSAIGHESDRPLCDEVADLRCGTPSLAAHAVVPDRAALEGELAVLFEVAAREVQARRSSSRERLKRAGVAGALATGLSRAHVRLERAEERLSWAHPQGAARAGRQRLSVCDWRRPVQAQLRTSEERLNALYRHAHSLSPQRVIERGFAVVRRFDGSVVRSPDQVQAGERLALTVAGGEIGAVVEVGRE
ncbi:MAG TPA: exodeoxyribonuclease VII large subunit [Acidimicrobiales bacterium]|nr:exodeoxyribonuclease VII large subunit [Acidimicrobiales bacterium]